MEKVIPSSGEMLIYKTDDGQSRVDVRLVDESLWMTQTDMAQLFQCSSDNISLHLKNIYDEGELSREPTAEEFSVVRQEGHRAVRRKMLFYNLDAVMRREYIERQAEEEYMKNLEQTAKQLPKKRKEAASETQV